MRYGRQEGTPLLQALRLEAERAEALVRFDVPGHRQGRMASDFSRALGDLGLRMDVNATPGLDFLDHPTGVIRDAECLMANACDADEAFFLVNGSSVGVVAMILSACGPGDTILLPRNVHRSAIHALVLGGAVPVFLPPEADPTLGIAHGVRPAAVRDALDRHPEARALLLLHPTYFGVCGDFAAIADLCRKRGVRLLSDSAHGAHFGFARGLPPSALSLGADLCTVSVHKTCGSLTQSSVLLLRERAIRHETVRGVLNLLQTSSASYLLLSSLDSARRWLVHEARDTFAALLPQVDDLRRRVAAIPGLRLMAPPEGMTLDPTKLTLDVSGLGISGFEAYRRLRERWGVQMELAEARVLLAVVSPADGPESLSRLADALEALAADALSGHPDGLPEPGPEPPADPPPLVLSPREAFFSPSRIVPLADAVGEICGETIMAYPPGIPLILPGERFNRDVTERIRRVHESGGTLVTEMDDPRRVRVLVRQEGGAP